MVAGQTTSAIDFQPSHHEPAPTAMPVRASPKTISGRPGAARVWAFDAGGQTGCSWIAWAVL